jgi:hypothetical protein
MSSKLDGRLIIIIFNIAFFANNVFREFLCSNLILEGDHNNYYVVLLLLIKYILIFTIGYNISLLRRKYIILDIKRSDVLRSRCTQLTSQLDLSAQSTTVLCEAIVVDVLR